MNPPDPADFVAPAYRSIGESLVRELGKLMVDPEMVSLAGGYPGPELFDREGLRAAVDEALREMPVPALQYGPTEGLPGLREQVARLLEARGTKASAGDVLVTGGSQQGFDLLVRTLLRAGDAAVVERPTYTGPLRVLKVAGVRTLTVGVDAHGLDVDELEAMLRDAATPRPKLLYVVPTFANPSGATMPRARRLKLLALAVEHRFVIVEDDPYGQLRFEGAHEPHIAGLVDEVPGSKAWTVHLGSFSKIVAPGLRLGYTVAPPPIRTACVLAKQLDDISSPGFTQATVQRYVAAGRLDAHLPKIVAAYRERANAMRDAIAGHLADRVEFNIPQGGMFMWGRLRDGASTRELLPFAIERKATFVPGDIYYAERADPSSMRLSFATPSPAQIREGVERIGAAIERMREPGAVPPAWPSVSAAR
ncbi:MAG: PLP-dependent aminotransferase family protein [Burkholderiales bacterium]